jgi:nitrate reductase NapD
MVISGLLISTISEKVEDVKRQLGSMKGLEIQSMIDDSKIVVVVETNSIEDEADISKEITKIEGVLGVNLAYHHFKEHQ